MSRKKSELDQLHCTEDEWLDLWRAYNTHRTDTLRVRKLALEHVALDFQRPPENLLTSANSRSGNTLLVYRDALFEFLKAAANCYVEAERQQRFRK